MLSYRGNMRISHPAAPPENVLVFQEAISDLRYVLEELEAVLLQEVKDSKRINYRIWYVIS